MAALTRDKYHIISHNAPRWVVKYPQTIKTSWHKTRVITTYLKQ